MLILLLLMAAPEQGGKVILNAGVPGADFYLDGNFVAATDESGMLTMENFPAGTFSYSIQKKGYSTYKGSFSVGEGETRMISPALAKLPEIGAAGEKAARPPLKLKRPAGTAKIAGTTQSPAAPAPPLPAQKSSAQGAAGPAGPASPEDAEAPWAWIAGIGLLVLALLAVLISVRKRRRPDPHLPLPDAEPAAEFPPAPSDAANRPAPGFIEELRRREELMNAGFVGSKPRVVDQDSMKEKEVVIVLPKEAFRYEDDK